MILTVSVENHRSIRRPIALSFISTSRNDEPSLRLGSKFASHGVLPVVGIWGANASGKTNLVSALELVRVMVRDSHARWEATRSVPWTPWALDKGPSAAPSRFEIDVEEQEVRYTFGFAVNEVGFIEEHLFRWQGSRKQILYQRDATGSDPWYFGPALKGPKTQIANSTRPNSLFLSAAAQANHSQLLEVYKSIVDGIIVERTIGLTGFPVFSKNHPLLSEAFRDSLVRILRDADVGVSDVAVKPHEPTPVPDEIAKMFKPESTSMFEASADDLREIHLIHGDGGWSLPPQDESRGTAILLARLADIVVGLRRGGLLLLDEIDTSLHPDLCAVLVALFTREDVNRNRAQLLFTTHNRDLLTTLRTDEVVLVDKGRDGVSSLAAASDYRGVRTREDLRRVHEEGRIRGVPVLGEIAESFTTLRKDEE